MKRIRLERVALVLSILAFTAEVFAYGYIKFEKDKMVVEATPSVVAYEELPKRIILDIVEDIEEKITQEVYFTCYYPFDEEGTTARTGSQLETKDFRINEYGMYTYQGKVVVACPTYEGLRSQYGVLKNFNDPNPNIVYYHYFDEFTIEIEGIGELDAICLDTIGAGMDWEYLQKYDEGLNRLDIFVAEKQYSFGKKKGFVK